MLLLESQTWRILHFYFRPNNVVCRNFEAFNRKNLVLLFCLLFSITPYESIDKGPKYWNEGLLQWIRNFHFKIKWRQFNSWFFFFHISKMQYCIHFYILLIMMLINWLLSCTKWKYSRLLFASSFSIYLPVI